MRQRSIRDSLIEQTLAQKAVKPTGELPGRSSLKAVFGKRNVRSVMPSVEREFGIKGVVEIDVAHPR